MSPIVRGHDPRGSGAPGGLSSESSPESPLCNELSSIEVNSTRTLPRIALTLLLLMSAAACGGSSEPSRAPTPTPRPNTLSSAKFTTVVPTGWTDMTANHSAVGSISAGGQVLMLLLAAGSTTLNEHIDVSLASQPVPQDQLAGYLQSVSHNGATNLSQPQSFDLDG